MDGLNWYAYCRSNPVNYVDPTGLLSEEGMERLKFLYGDDLTDSIIDAKDVRERYENGEKISFNDAIKYYDGIADRIVLDIERFEKIKKEGVDFLEEEFQSVLKDQLEYYENSLDFF